MKERSVNPKKIQNIYRQIGKNVKLICQKEDVSQLELPLAIRHKAVGTVSMAKIRV